MIRISRAGTLVISVTEFPVSMLLIFRFFVLTFFDLRYIFRLYIEKFGFEVIDLAK